MKGLSSARRAAGYSRGNNHGARLDSTNYIIVEWLFKHISNPIYLHFLYTEYHNEIMNTYFKWFLFPYLHTSYACNNFQQEEDKWLH